MHLKQIPLKSIPHGLAHPVALLENAPGLIEESLQIKFERARDDLDDIDAAVLVSNKGFYFALVYHLNAPVKGAEILISEKSKDLRGELEEALRLLAPIDPKVIWRHPSAV